MRPGSLAQALNQTVAGFFPDLTDSRYVLAGAVDGDGEARHHFDRIADHPVRVRTAIAADESCVHVIPLLVWLWLRREAHLHRTAIRIRAPQTVSNADYLIAYRCGNPFFL